MVRIPTRPPWWASMPPLKSNRLKMSRISSSARYAERAALFFRKMQHPKLEPQLSCLENSYSIRRAVTRMGDPKLKLLYQSTSCEGVIAVDAATAVARTIKDCSARSFKISRHQKNPLSRTIITQIGDALKFLSVNGEAMLPPPAGGRCCPWPPCPATETTPAQLANQELFLRPLAPDASRLWPRSANRIDLKHFCGRWTFYPRSWAR